MPDSSRRLEPQYDVAAAFVAALTGSPDASIRLRFIHDRDDGPCPECEGKLAHLWPDILKYQAKGLGVFYFLNAVEPGPGSGSGGCAKDADVGAIRYLGIDADNGLPDQWELHTPSHLVVKTSVVNGAQRGQILWRVADCSVDGFKELQQRLAKHYDTDSQVCNPSRVFRLPGTLHQKREPQLVTFDRGMARLPAHTVEAITVGLPELSPEKARTQHDPTSNNREPVSIDHLRTLLDHIQPWTEGDGENRGPWRNIIAAIRAVNTFDASEDDRLELAKEWSARWDGWDNEAERELKKIWRTMPPKPSGVAYGSIYHRAVAGGYSGGRYRKPASEAFKGVIGNYQMPPGDGASGQKPGDDPFAKQPNPRIKFMSESAIFNLPDPAELIAGFLMDRELACIVGLPKGGKTFLGIEIAYSLASGNSMVGATEKTLQVNRKGFVVYLSGEGHGGFKRRLKAWRQERGIDPAVKLPFIYNPAVPLASAGEDEIRDFAEAIEALEREYDDEVVLIIIDTLARAMSGLNENDAGDANQYLDLAEGLRTRCGCTVLTIAHTIKDARDKEKLEIRGSSAFTGGFDSVWQVVMNETNKTVKLSARWLKETDELGPFYFRLTGVTVEGMMHGKGAVLTAATKKEFEDKPVGAVQDENAEIRKIVSILMAENARERDDGYVWGLEPRELAEKMSPFPGGDEMAVALWRGKIDKLVKHLANVLRPRKLADGRTVSSPYRVYCRDDAVKLGTMRPQRLWVLPKGFVSPTERAYDPDDGTIL